MKMLQRVRELSAQVDEMTEALEETEDELAKSQAQVFDDPSAPAPGVHSLL
jgi:Tfp pilus assembly protein FimV